MTSAMNKKVIQQADGRSTTSHSSLRRAADDPISSDNQLPSNRELSEAVSQRLRQMHKNGRICGNTSCSNDDRKTFLITDCDDRGFVTHVRCTKCDHVMLATPVDIGVLTILRRHSTEGTLCDNVECSMDDPSLLDVVGNCDEFGFIRYVRCSVCGQLMSTNCYDNAARKRIRVLSFKELKTGDHIAWHNAVGHWHNVIFLEALGMESDGRTSRLSVIEYRYRGCCNNGVTESVRKLDFSIFDVYRYIYVDCYTDAYSVERARRLTRPGTSIHPLIGGCENIARWCKTGHRTSKVSLVVQKLSFEKQEMNVVHKTSTFLSLALANGLIPDASSGVKVIEAVIFSIIPAVVFFFSIVVAQVKREHDEIEPRRENVIIRKQRQDDRRRTFAELETQNASPTTDTTCCSFCDADNWHKWCATYAGPLTRVAIRELIAIIGPIVAFVGVGIAVSGVLADKTWAIAIVELVSALFASPPSFAVGVLIGSLVERYCCRCGCVSSSVSQQEPQQQQVSINSQPPGPTSSQVKAGRFVSSGSNSSLSARSSGERLGTAERTKRFGLDKVSPV